MDLLQIATAFLLQKWDTVYYKLLQVLQSAIIITNCDSTLTFRQIKWTECKKWKRNGEKFNL